MQYMRASKYLLLIAVAVLSCTPQRRFSRLIDKHPHLLTIDSVTVRDTFIVEVPKVVHDTLISQHFFTQITRDTLVLQKERLTVKIFHDTIKKNVFIRGECDTITVEKIVERKIPVKYYEKTPTWKKIINWVMLVIVVLSILYGLYRLLNLVKKKI